MTCHTKKYVARTVEVTCQHCSKAFTYEQKGSGRRRKACSDDCHRHIKNAWKRENQHRYRDRYPKKQFHRECVVCSRPFSTINGRTRACGPKCGAILSGIVLSSKARAANERPCPRCEKLFIPCHPSARQKARGYVQRYCGYECARMARRETPAVPKVPKPRSPGQTLSCGKCGKSFVGPKNRRFCSKGCSREHYNIAAVAKYGKDTSPRACRWCSELFSPIAGLRDSSLYCSKEHGRAASRQIRKHKGRAERYGGQYAIVVPEKVFERDKWRCHICKRKTLPRLRGTYDDRAPELDHIQPISLSGDHSYENTACACRKCNSLKSNTPLGQPWLFDVTTFAAANEAGG